MLRIRVRAWFSFGLRAKGGGKSTTLRTLSGLVTASQGTVRFLGEDTTTVATLPRRRLVHVPKAGGWPVEMTM
jgi:ABC-type multidrug transport system ATPase subunit